MKGVKQTGSKKWWIKIVAAVVAVAIIGGAIIWSAGNIIMPKAGVIAEAKYPEVKSRPDIEDYAGQDDITADDAYMKAYDEWVDEQLSKHEIEIDTDTLTNYFADSTKEFLSEAGDENAVYSPLNVYMALGLLAEVTDGNSREQILNLLGVEDISELRSQANKIWNKEYRNDGAVSRIMANSIWLNEDVKYNKTTLDSLAENYYASSYKGKMGSDEFNKMIQDWLNSQTKDFLSEQTSNVEFAPDTVLGLASTIYFQAKWSSEFNEELTESDIFHGASGDVEAKFMHESDSDIYYWDDKYAAVQKSFDEWGGTMWFILPDEGVSVDEILSEKKYMELTTGEKEWKNQKVVVVNSAIPKFDISSDLELKDGLKKLGITDVFDAKTADFTPLTEDMDKVEISKAEHAARVSIDEEGVIAAAYTVEAAAGAAIPPDEEVDFILNRPFIFVINSAGNLPLFVGVVKNPSR